MYFEYGFFSDCLYIIFSDIDNYFEPEEYRRFTRKVY